MPILVFLYGIMAIAVVVLTTAAWGMFRRDKFTIIYPLTVFALLCLGALLNKFASQFNPDTVKAVSFIIGGVVMAIIMRIVNKLRDR